MKIHFHKYQATGNDFVLIDNRTGTFSFSVKQIQKICDRRFGVGADGLILIEKDPTFDFNLNYYNSDGSQSLCGNGSRAGVVMAASLGLLNDKTKFNAYDGVHEAELLPTGIVRLKMNPVVEVKKIGSDFFINTGSPHHLRFVKNVKDYAVFEEGKKIRYSKEYDPQGANANFIELEPNNTISVRTYERGVEDETFSCGTGVTAAALASSYHGYKSPVQVNVMGGTLSVEFKSDPVSGFSEIFLIGSAVLVFEGFIEI